MNSSSQLPRRTRVALWAMRATGSWSPSLEGDLLEEINAGRGTAWLYLQVGTALARHALHTVLALGLFYTLVAFAVQIGERILGGWPSTEYGLVAAAALAILFALKLRARVAAYVIAGLGAYFVAELGVHLVYGLRAAQGAPAHLAVMGAGLLGVCFGALLARAHKAATWIRAARAVHLALFLSVFAGASVWAQTTAPGTNVASGSSQATPAPTFEVVSVKRNHLPNFVQRSRIQWTPGRLTATNVTLKQLIMSAHDLVVDSRLLGGPDWLDETTVNIEATAPGRSKAEMQIMLRQLLKQRFRLVAKGVTRSLPVYKLVRARKDGRLPAGMKITPCTKPDEAPVEGVAPSCESVGFGNGGLFAASVTLSRLANVLSVSSTYTDIDRLVLNETGLTDAYTFTLNWAPTRQILGLRWDPKSELPSFPTALEEQTGLKLQPANAQVEVLVIQSASWPELD